MSSTNGTGKPKVLAITMEGFAIRQLRLEMPLLNLKRQGLIEDYVVTDHSFQQVPDNYQFDTVWLQRQARPRLSSALEDVLENNFLYDIDDLLIGRPTYTMCLENDMVKGAVMKALGKCKVLTCSTRRLVGLLESYTGATLSQKAVICPNGFEFSKALRKPEQPEGLVWTSSDFPAVMQSREAIVNAVRKFSGEYDLPVYCFGFFRDRITRHIRNLVELGPVPFFHHKALLGSFPPLIGVAPLETVADQRDLDFINSKSDLKMVEFGGFGHPSVYSDAPPYTDTDLRCGVIATNDESCWFDAMESIYREKWRGLHREQIAVVEARNMDRIAFQCWHEAVLKAQLGYLVSGSDIKNAVNERQCKRGAGSASAWPRRPKRRPLSWSKYDEAYCAWKELRKRRVPRHEAFKIIRDKCGVRLFFLLYPFYKALRPFRKLKIFLESG